MAKSKAKRPAHSDSSWTSSMERRLNALEEAYTELADAYAERLADLVKAHNDLDRQAEITKYMAIFIMQRIEVTEQPKRDGIVLPNEKPVHDLLYAFWLRDRTSFIAMMKDMEAKIAAQIDSAHAANPSRADATRSGDGSGDIPILSRGPKAPQ